MPDTPNRVVIERVQWLEVFPILRLASAFRHALQPGKLVVALLAVLLIHFSGAVLDALWGLGDEPDDAVAEQRADDVWVGDNIVFVGDNAVQQRDGVYQSLMAAEGAGFLRLQSEAISLDVMGVFTGLRRVVFDIPAAYVHEHPWFMLLFGADALLILALASGIICRMSATQVCHGKLTALPRAAKFVARRWAWYLLTPLLPAGLALFFGLLLMLAGLVFFNLPVLDVVGALLYGLLLLLGFGIALVGFVLILALFLMPPAMSVEGTDAFDAISRAFNYVLYKPWQYAAYLAGSVFYLAVVYVILSLLAGLTVAATHSLVGVGGFAESNISGMTHYEAISNRYEADADPGTTAEVSSWIVARWLELLGAIVLALMLSTTCSLATQVYVLMRRAGDGAPLDDCAADDEAAPWSSPEDMVDPAAQAIAASGPKGHPKPDEAEAETEADPPAEHDEPNDKPGDAPKQD